MLPVNDTRSFNAPGPVRLAVFFALATLAYLIATSFTDWVFIGDAPDWARSSAARLFGVDCKFLEFGHLAWRPLGSALLTVVDSPTTGDTYRALSLDALRNLGGASWALGLVGVLSAAGWLRNVVRSYLAAGFGVVTLIACKAYLNFAQVGSSYVPGLAFLLTALFVASLEPTSARARIGADIVAGLCFAASALLWATFALALPGAVLSSLVLSTAWRRQLPRVVLSGGVGVATLVIVYLAVGRILGFNSAADYSAWIVDAGHGITTGGFSRAVVGLARSFVDLGDFGRSVKYYMLRDPYNPVPLRDLLTFDLLKILAFYLTMLVALVASWRGAVGRRALLAATLIAIPVLVFAVAWQGGDLERYLPAMPGIILLMAAGFHEAQRSTLLRVSMLVGVAIFIGSNAVAMSNRAVDGESDAVVARLGAYGDRDLSKQVFLVSHWQDDVMTFHRNRPFHPLNLDGLNVFALMTPATPGSANWRRNTARRILTAWRTGKDVLLSNRLLAEVPQRHWNWVEGDDPTVRWRDFSEFFQRLDIASATAGNAEFVLLRPSLTSRALLESVAPLGSVTAQGDSPKACNVREPRLVRKPS